MWTSQVGSDARIDQLEGRNPESSDQTRDVHNMIFSRNSGVC